MLLIIKMIVNIKPNLNKAHSLHYLLIDSINQELRDDSMKIAFINRY